MKFQCSLSVLREAVQMLSPVCPSRTTLPILSNVLVQATQGELALMGTDLDVSMRTTIAAEVGKTGETTVPVRFLLDALRRMNAETISVTVDDLNVMTLRAGDKVQCSLRGMAPGDFPRFPKIEAADTVQLPIKELNDMLRATSYAVSRDETRYVLNGVCFNFAERFDVVATDGRRLAKYTNASIKRDEPRQLVVPSKSIAQLQQMLSGDGTVDIRFSATQMEVTVNQTKLVTRLVDGHYPNYMQVIPKSCQHVITLNRRAFLDACGLASVVTEKTKQPVIRITLQQQRMTISATTAEIGDAKDVLEVKYSGDDMEMAFNPTFLTECCQSLDTDEVMFEVTNAASPIVLRAGDAFLCVVMPMRL
jgi:DNA polymerase-3 subunit beta